MAKVIVNESTLSDIAVAIRARNKTWNWYKPSEMADAIRKIPNYGGISQGSIVDSNIVDRSISGSYSNDMITEIGAYSFCNCRHLVGINCPEVTKVGTSAFEFADGLKDVNLPKVTTLGANAFNNTNALEEINLPSLTALDECEFYGSDIQKATFESLNGIYNDGKDFYTSPFAFCVKLTELNVPNLEIIHGPEVFGSCTKLKELYLPNIKGIGENSLKNSSITDIYVGCDEARLPGAPWGATNATVHYNYTEGGLE